MKIFPILNCARINVGARTGVLAESSGPSGCAGTPGVKLPHILGRMLPANVEVGEYLSGFKLGTVLIAPMVFCGRCAKCVAGVQNQCREFAVLGNAVDGGNCELIAVPSANVIPIPDSLDFNQAASVPLVFVTHGTCLWDERMRSGQTVLGAGASSGVGIAAIQIAKLFHCRVITTAGDEASWQKARELARIMHQSLSTKDFEEVRRSRTKKRRYRG